MRLTELTNISKSPTTERSRRFISDVVMESELLQWLNNFSLGATKDQYRVADGSQTLASRALAGSYTSENMSPADLISAQLKIHGFILHYDESYEKDHELGLGLEMDMWLEQELEDRSIDTSEAVESLIIAGDGIGDNMTGLATILNGANDIPGLGFTGVIDAAVSGEDSFDISAESSFAEYEERQEKWMADLKRVDGIICNRSMGARLKTIARENNSYNEGLNQFGQRLEMINGVPIIRVLDTVITNSEPDNATTPVENTTSIYLVRNAVGHWDIKSNSGLAIWEPGELQEEKMSRALKFEMRGRNQIRRKRAVRRVRNIKL